MKKLLTISCVLFYAFSYSQIEYDKYKDFDMYALPSNSNELSKYFRENINIKLLDAIRFQDTIENNKRIILEFKINKKFKVNNLRVNSQYYELNNEIKEAFKNYDLRKLNLPKESELYTYKIQIISNYNNRAIINCSTHIIYDKLPIYEGCESKMTHSNLSTCNYKKLEAHVLNNMDAKVIEESKILGELKLFPKFTIDAQGDITHITSKAPNDALILELNRVISLLSKVKPATRNGKPILYNTSSAISLVIEPKSDTIKKLVFNDVAIFYPKGSDLASHFRENLDMENFSNMNLPVNQKNIILYFGIDKKGEYINVRNTLQIEELSSKINEVFKEYPIEKHNIDEIDLLATYSYILLTKLSVENAFRFSDQKELMSLRPPTFEGCEKSKNSDELKKCNWDNIMFYINKEFDVSLRNKTKLTDDIRINSTFKVDSLGKIIDVKVRAPNPYLANEMESIIKNMPYKIIPGLKNSKPLNYPFSFPFYFNINKNHQTEDFKNEIFIRKH